MLLILVLNNASAKVSVVDNNVTLESPRTLVQLILEDETIIADSYFNNKVVQESSQNDITDIRMIQNNNFTSLPSLTITSTQIIIAKVLYIYIRNIRIINNKRY